MNTRTTRQCGRDFFVLLSAFCGLAIVLLLAGCGDTLRETCQDAVIAGHVEVCGNSNRLTADDLNQAQRDAFACLGIHLIPVRVHFKPGPIRADQAYTGWTDFTTLDITLDRDRAGPYTARHEFIHVALVLLGLPGGDNAGHNHPAFASCTA